MRPLTVTPVVKDQVQSAELWGAVDGGSITFSIATIDTQAQQLSVYHHPGKDGTPCLIQQFDYTLAEDARPLDSAYHRPRSPLEYPVKDFNC